MGRAARIGGFFELGLDSIPESEDSIAATWFAPGYRSFRNARSALAFLLQQLAPATIWLPAYSCESIVSSVPVGYNISWYSCGPLLRDAPISLSLAAPGDVVLAIDYFGRPPPPAFLDYRADRPDLIWIEDRAQALDPGVAPWGDWVIYSPRKLLGVPDGGFIVGPVDRLSMPPINPGHAPETDMFLPMLMRYEDQYGSHNEAWYPKYVLAESMMRVCESPSSRLTEEILRRVPIGPIKNKRIENAKYILSRIEKFVLWRNDELDYVPLGIPVLVRRPETFVREMAASGIFCARHWKALMAPVEGFQEEHRLSALEVTLPVDQRLSLADMDRIVENVLRFAECPE